MNLRELEPGAVERKLGEVILEVEGVSLSFGGSRSLSLVFGALMDGLPGG